MTRPLKHVLISVLVLLVGMAVLQASLLDGVDGWLLARIYGDDTEYAKGYSDDAFQKIKPGITKTALIGLLGSPLRQSWRFERDNGESVWVSFDHAGRADHSDPKELIASGTTMSAVQESLGQPNLEVFNYSRSPNDRSYRVRVVHLVRGLVTNKVHEYYLD